MSAIFQRPVCDMGKAYDFSFRSFIGDADAGAGGPCDDHPHRVELYSATADVNARSAEWRIFSLCPEHEGQLRRYDGRLATFGVSTRFRSPAEPLEAPPPTRRSAGR
ncbi:MAG: hypothetical protein ACREDE_05815 [Thermoplasmata archaeon]